MSSLSAGIIHKTAVGVTSKQCIQADTQLSGFIDSTLSKQNPNKVLSRKRIGVLRKQRQELNMKDNVTS